VPFHSPIAYPLLCAGNHTRATSTNSLVNLSRSRMVCVYNVFSSCSALRVVISNSPTGYARPKPRNRAKFSASFISVRCPSVLFDLAIDITQNQLRKQEAAPPRVLGTFCNLAAGATPNLPICTRARARGPLSVKYLSGVFPSPRGDFPIFSPLSTSRTPQ